MPPQFSPRIIFNKIIHKSPQMTSGLAGIFNAGKPTIKSKLVESESNLKSFYHLFFIYLNINKLQIIKTVEIAGRINDAVIDVNKKPFIIK